MELRESVLGVQTRLQELGYYKGSLSSKYDADTLGAVRDFQAANSLTADGIAGDKTFAKLFSASAIPYTQTAGDQYKTLSSGSTGTEVSTLQSKLMGLGYSCTVTGTYDSATKNAVIAFQLRNSLVADGIAGKDTQTTVF